MYFIFYNDCRLLEGSSTEYIYEFWNEHGDVEKQKWQKIEN